MGWEQNHGRGQKPQDQPASIIWAPYSSSNLKGADRHGFLLLQKWILWTLTFHCVTWKPHKKLNREVLPGQASFSQSPHCVAANWPLITILKWRARDARAGTFYRNNLMTYSKLSTINFKAISYQLSLMSRLLQLSSQPATVFEGTDTFCYSSHVKTYFSARVKFHSKEFKGPGWCESMNCHCM